MYHISVRATCHLLMNAKIFDVDQLILQESEAIKLVHISKQET
jgi:hypothetical protein